MIRSKPKRIEMKKRETVPALGFLVYVVMLLVILVMVPSPSPCDMKGPNRSAAAEKDGTNVTELVIGLRVIVDTSMLSFHGGGGQLRAYVEGISSDAARLFSHPSLGISVRLHLISLTEDSKDDEDAYINDAMQQYQKLVRSRNKYGSVDEGNFKDGRYQEKLDPTELIGALYRRANQTIISQSIWTKVDDGPPTANVLLTRRNLCSAESGGECRTLGVASGTICSSSGNFMVVKDTGLNHGAVLAHEVGHLLGMTHDDEEKCQTYMRNRADSEISSKIMSSTLNSGFLNGWTSCSRHELEELVRNLAESHCMANGDWDILKKGRSISGGGWRARRNSQVEQDVGEDDFQNGRGHKYLLPGQLYKADEQCQLIYGHTTVNGSKARACDNVPIKCGRISYRILLDDDWTYSYLLDLENVLELPGMITCTSSNIPWADGTPCKTEENDHDPRQHLHWCIKGHCVPQEIVRLAHAPSKNRSYEHLESSPWSRSWLTSGHKLSIMNRRMSDGSNGKNGACTILPLGASEFVAWTAIAAFHHSVPSYALGCSTVIIFVLGKFKLTNLNRKSPKSYWYKFLALLLIIFDTKTLKLTVISWAVGVLSRLLTIKLIAIVRFILSIRSGRCLPSTLKTESNCGSDKNK